MSESSAPELEEILQFCAQSAPQPWYPSEYAQTTGTARDALDLPLERLRQGGFIQLTDWVAGKGQGYRLTPEGQQLLTSPRALAQVRSGQLPTGPGPRAAELPGDDRGSLDVRRDAVREAFEGGFTRPRVTLGLIAINVGVFLAGYFLADRLGVPTNEYLAGSNEIGNIQILHLTGAARASDVLVRHEWWRLLTCCFVHIGLVHLAVNMYSLYIMGPLLERLWGPGRFLVLYLLSGLGGSCAMLWDTPLSQGAGASGALWGIMGSMVTWIVLHRRILNPQLVAEWRRQLIVNFVLNFGITLAVPAISKGAHFGGCLVGLVAAVPLDWLRFGGRGQRLFGAITLLLIPAACVGGLVYGLAPKRQVVELEVFEKVILPPLVRANKDTNGGMKAFYELVNQHADRRDPERVRDTLEKLQATRTGLQNALKDLDASGTPTATAMRQLQDATRELLTTWSQYYEAAEDYLRKGADATAADERTVEERQHELKKRGLVWSEAYDAAGGK